MSESAAPRLVWTDSDGDTWSEPLPTRISFSGLTYRLSEQRPEGVCEACDGVVALTNDAMYEHAARCPSKGWAHGV